ncbi:MAG TPA: hypothetical protein VHH55_01825 [Gaiellaceae bacterium]|jgi:hypothetical protein|nr:hypothetical protein [Gaiellaceae bacterium]
MPSRKQRRRRAKDRRHEWEYVYVDDSGEEVEAPDEAVSRNGKRAPQERKASTSGMREVQPPSWRRVGRRGLLFAPLMFLTVYIFSNDLTLGQQLLNTAFLLAFFLPFSYAMDTLMYRLYRRRTGAR